MTRKLIFVALLISQMGLPASAGELSFDRDIQPILSEHCLQCHGPDKASRKAKLRLDTREDAMADRKGYPAIVPGDPEASELWVRVSAEDPIDQMPPEEFAKPLDAEQKEKLRLWIEQGAEWSEHWAFVPPERPEVPASAKEWARNPVDEFVHVRLSREDLTPAEPASSERLLRRLSLDITGLPPTLPELDAFLAEDIETAYPKAVKRLLDSPHYGERWARIWLDSAQYADSDGFEKDKPREVWAWRDWVINAFNANKPYDEFITEQIAGDLLPGATQDQIVATGFLRNSMINEEGGIDPEQFRMEALFNRMDVIGRSVLGLTVQCAQCHTHKYDPLTHDEYYGLLAYINNSHEALIPVLSPEERERRAEVEARILEIEADIKSKNPDWKEKLAAWEDRVAAQPKPDWKPLSLIFDDTASGGQKFLEWEENSYMAAGYAPTRFRPKMSGPSPVRKVTAVKLELLMDPNLPKGGPGRSIFGTAALSDFEMYVGPASEPVENVDKWERVEIASAIADVNPRKRRLRKEFTNNQDRKDVTGPISLAIDGNGDTAWTTDDGVGRRNQPRYAIFKLAKPIEISDDQQIGIKLIQLQGGSDSNNNQNYNIGRFRLSVTSDDDLPEIAVSESVRSKLAKSDRTEDDDAKIFRYWRRSTNAFPLPNMLTEKAWANKPEGTTQLVYMERDEMRPTFRLNRGDFLSPLEEVEPKVPAFLHPMNETSPKNRLGLAQWLTDAKSATTARVFVNRVWQAYFGRGLVATASDFGLQGARPTHPELLDWLAVEFVESGWDVKKLHELIVSSATYRQDSAATPEQLERDPENKLLARGSRFRVDGEIVRDVALAASGLISLEVGGPSVYPPAPGFLFEAPASYGNKHWKTSQGAEAYRRALYTFRFRSVPYPALQVFDTPDGNAPCTERERSNTPLQALTLLNEPIFLECARSLARETLAQTGDDKARLISAFRRCTSRTPDPEDLEVLQAFLNEQRERIEAGEVDTQTLVGDAEATELAAWTLTARVLLNLDETITRN